MASPVAEHRLRTRRLSGHGSRAQPLRGMWDLPSPGHEPVSPPSAGGLSTTVPPGKPHPKSFKCASFLPFIPLQTLPHAVAKGIFWSPLLAHTLHWFLLRSVSRSCQASGPFLMASTCPHLAPQPGMLCSHGSQPLSSCSWSLSHLGLCCVFSGHFTRA